MQLVLKIVLFLIFIYSSACSQEKKHIILLNSYHHGMEWTDDITAEVIKKYGYQGSNYSLHVEYMDTKNIHSQEYFEQLYELYKKKYSHLDVELIFSSDNHALDFLLQYRDKIFGNIPVIFCGINNYKESMIKGYENYTGIVEYFSIQDTVKTILKLHPNIRHLYVLNDYLKTGIETQKIIQERIDAMGLDVHVSYSEPLSVNELRRKVASMEERSVILLGFFFADRYGVHVSAKMLKDEILKESSVPIYALSEFYVGGAIVGGKVINAKQQGKFISSLGVQILNGTNIKMLPVTTKGTNNYIFDYNALKHYNIDIDRLPATSLIKNKETTFYERYTLLVNITLFFIILLLIVIFFLIKNIQQRKRKEEEIRSLNENLESLVQTRTKELKESNENLKETISYLEKTQNTLVGSIKMARLGELVASVTQEVNTPLGLGITGFTHFQTKTREVIDDYEKGKLTQKEFEEYIYNALNISNTVLKNLNKAAELMRSFKNIAIDQSTEKKRVFQVKEYIQDIINSLQHKLKKTKHSLHVECNQEIYVNTSASAFSQILSNLILYSLMHSLKQIKEGNIQIFFTKNDEGKCTLCYEDDGSGLPYNTILRDKEHPNQLGLGNIKDLVEHQLHGSIEVQNYKSSGTRFVISFYSA